MYNVFIYILYSLFSHDLRCFPYHINVTVKHMTAYYSCSKLDWLNISETIVSQITLRKKRDSLGQGFLKFCRNKEIDKA